jgi:phosphate:Na+ symporter
MAIFIFGIQLLSEGLEKVAGPKLLTFLEKATANRFKSLFFGVVIVGLLHSSGMLMVSLIGLINAGMLTLEQAVNIMLGSEIGTTITGQLVAFNLKGIELIFLFVGFCLANLNTKRKWQRVGQPLFGLGLVFFGMKMMSSAGEVFSQLPAFQKVLETLSQNAVLGVLVGAIFTAIMQSSTTMTGLVIALGISNSITLPAAISLILGANIGSCITGWLASIKSSLNAKRASYAQIFINVGGVLLFLPFITPFSKFIAATSTLLPRQIANAHTIFNVVVSFLMLPMVSVLTKLVKKVVRRTGAKEEGKLTKYIDDRLLSSPFMAVTVAKAEILRMGWFAYQMLRNAKKSFLQGKKKHAHAVLHKEPDIAEICHQVNRFMENIPPDKLNQADRNFLDKLKCLVTDIKRVGGHAVNLAEFAIQIDKKDIKMTKYAHKELEILFDTVIEHYGFALKAFKKNDPTLVIQVEEIEVEVDKMKTKFKKNHIERLRKGLCQPEADPIYVESLRILERISDHSYNIALSVSYLEPKILF